MYVKLLQHSKLLPNSQMSIPEAAREQSYP